MLFYLHLESINLSHLNVKMKLLRNILKVLFYTVRWPFLIRIPFEYNASLFEQLKSELSQVTSFFFI